MLVWIDPVGREYYFEREDARMYRRTVRVDGRATWAQVNDRLAICNRITTNHRENARWYDRKLIDGLPHVSGIMDLIPKITAYIPTQPIPIENLAEFTLIHGRLPGRLVASDKLCNDCPRIDRQHCHRLYEMVINEFGTELIIEFCKGQRLFTAYYRGSRTQLNAITQIYLLRQFGM